jgi:5-methyltetrahydropteroyltriglutamate--homocysteine methyltransferase
MKSENRILTTHVGSLVRPQSLLSTLEAWQQKPADRAPLDATLQQAVDEVVREQAAAGVDIVSDGEFGKFTSWSQYVIERLNGFERRPAPDAVSRVSTRGKDYQDYKDFYTEYEGTYGRAGLGKSVQNTGLLAVVGPVTYNDAAVKGDIARLKQALQKNPGVTGFLPVVAPASAAPLRQDEYYKSDEEFLFAIADALHHEYKAITDSGLEVQIDDAYLASSFDVIAPKEGFAAYRKWAELRVEALNHALKGIPTDKVRYHICWGSWNGPHSNDVALKDIVDLVLRVNAGGYSLEMANPRHEHEWRVWETTKLSDGKVLLPGVISHSTNVLEHPELVSERIVRLARLVGRERIIASTDCGFAQGAFGRRVHPSIQWGKLRALAEGSALATGILWQKAAAA